MIRRWGCHGSRSVRPPIRLGRFVPSENRRAPHPLLLERGYWRNRLRALKLVRPSALYTPRPDLSSRSVRIEEFRVKAHDGKRLVGLHGRRVIGAATGGVRLRLVPHGRALELDLDALRDGCIEYAVQLPAARRLEDRVLDVLRICELAAAKEGIAPQEIRLKAGDGGLKPDEFLIVTELLAVDVESEER